MFICDIHLHHSPGIFGPWRIPRGRFLSAWGCGWCDHCPTGRTAPRWLHYPPPSSLQHWNRSWSARRLSSWLPVNNDKEKYWVRLGRKDFYHQQKMRRIHNRENFLKNQTSMGTFSFLVKSLVPVFKNMHIELCCRVAIYKIFL